MDTPTIIAKLKAKDGAEDQLFEECRKLVGPTRAEEGCINYDMHRSVEDPGLIMFYENWTAARCGGGTWSPRTCRSSRPTPTTSSRCGSCSRARRLRAPELPPGSLDAGIM